MELYLYLFIFPLRKSIWTLQFYWYECNIQISYWDYWSTFFSFIASYRIFKKKLLKAVGVINTVRVLQCLSFFIFNLFFLLSVSNRGKNAADKKQKIIKEIWNAYYLIKDYIGAQDFIFYMRNRYSHYRIDRSALYNIHSSAYIIDKWMKKITFD